MPLKSQNVSEVIRSNLGSLRACLVEGDADQRNRERRIRRRALVISILLQSAVLAALVLVPLFGKTERIALARPIPIPPYSSHPGVSRASTPVRPHGPQNPCRFCAPPNIPPTIPPHDSQPQGEGTTEAPFEGLGPGIPGSTDGIIPLDDARRKGPEPIQVEHRTEQPRIVHMTHLDPAMLIRRIEPIYPPLARQIHREGRVEMRARIATDGTIQLLEIVGGDPMFYQSAKDAVSQWLYRPTVLNGQKVEIDTYITVIYTMQHY